MKRFLTVALLMLPLPLMAAPYTVDYANSTITFSGEHAGNAFSGVFEEWEAELVFDPSAPESSQFNAHFQLASAKTGNAMYDGTLPQGDWFKVDEHPTGSFTSRSIQKTEGENSYSIEGDLTLRGFTHPVSFTFTLEAEGDAEKATASFTVDRLAYDIGKGSDASAEWVSQHITITLDILARKRHQ